MTNPSCINPCNVCNCQTSVPLQTSYYDCNGNVQETHCQSVVQQLFATAISNSSDFVMPLCNASVAVQFPGVIQLQKDSYLWSGACGYLRVQSFDHINQVAVLINDCIVGNALPGAIIARCTLFNVVDSPMGVSLNSSSLGATGNSLMTASQIITHITFVTAADGVKGVKLPATPTVGSEYVIYNTAGYALNIYPGSAGDQINVLGIGNPLIVLAYGSAIINALNTSQWWAGRMS